MTRATIGSTTITHLSDGQFQLTRDLFPDADASVTQILPAQLNVFHIQDGKRSILIDSGAAKTYQRHWVICRSLGSQSVTAKRYYRCVCNTRAFRSCGRVG